MSDSIKQEVTFTATPERIYEALLDAQKFSQMTGGATAEIDAKAGGAFSCFGGIVTGRNIELQPRQHIVQAWRAGNWPQGVYSIVHFKLAPADQNTKLTMTHAGFPSEMREHLDGGWHKMYWDPLKRYLA
jgi:activator of HSP90 ATPase